MEEYIKKSNLIEEFTKRQLAWEVAAADSTIVNGLICKFQGKAEAYKNTCTIIERMPSADVVEVKRGEWIYHTDDIECSVCGHCTYEYEANYCSECGADMRKWRETE